MPHRCFICKVVRASDMPLFTCPDVGSAHTAWSAALPAHSHLLSSKPYICGQHFPVGSVVSIRAGSTTTYGLLSKALPSEGIITRKVYPVCFEHLSYILYSMHCLHDAIARCLNKRNIDLLQHKVYVPIFQIIDTKNENSNCLEVMIVSVISHYSAVCLPACNITVNNGLNSTTGQLKEFIPNHSYHKHIRPIVVRVRCKS